MKIEINMKTLFNSLQKKNPYLSSLIVFNNMIIEGNFSEQDIDRNFDLFVDKKDYARKDKEVIILHTKSLL